MTEESNRERVGARPDADYVDLCGLEQMVVEFDRGQEILTPRLNRTFDSYDLYQARMSTSATLAPHLQGMGLESVPRGGDRLLHGTSRVQVPPTGARDPAPAVNRSPSARNLSAKEERTPTCAASGNG